MDLAAEKNKQNIYLPENPQVLLPPERLCKIPHEYQVKKTNEQTEWEKWRN